MKTSSASSAAEFLVCNDSGYALLTADQRLGGKVVAIPQEITQEVLTGSGLYQGRSSLGGAYTSKQFVVGVPVQDGDQTIGVVLADHIIVADDDFVSMAQSGYLS